LHLYEYSPAALLLLHSDVFSDIMSGNFIEDVSHFALVTTSKKNNMSGNLILTHHAKLVSKELTLLPHQG
jgi:hypothetical protein